MKKEYQNKEYFPYNRINFPYNKFFFIIAKIILTIPKLFLHSNKKIEKVLTFANHLPELFLKAEPEEKKLILTTMTKSVKFDGENLIVNLKDTFKALQNVKKCGLETYENDNLRTHETLADIKKDPHSEGLIKNGAPDGIRTHAYRNHNPRS